MSSNNNRYTHGVNEAGRAAVDTEVKVRYKPTSKNPWVLLLTGLLNAFGNIISPIKDERKR